MFIVSSYHFILLLFIRIAGIGTWLIIKGIAVLLNKIFGLEDPTIIKEDVQEKKIMEKEEDQKQPQVIPEETAQNEETAKIEMKVEGDVEA